jgi:hypothetical protein
VNIFCAVIPKDASSVLSSIETLSKCGWLSEENATAGLKGWGKQAMAAPIVYEGRMQGHGGTLFHDMKFWVAHRVPMRTTWIQNIEVWTNRAPVSVCANELQNNGGSIVLLDKKADFLIADHARKDVPVGSYSWKWIEDSVKSGKLQNKEDYCISTPGNETRPVGSIQQKPTRNPFTKEDDLLLANFVTKHERLGTATSGNIIYKQLEAKVHGDKCIQGCTVLTFHSIPTIRFSLGGIAG